MSLLCLRQSTCCIYNCFSMLNNRLFSAVDRCKPGSGDGRIYTVGLISTVGADAKFMSRFCHSCPKLKAIVVTNSFTTKCEM